jgi:peptidyl-prolyl cis-trans isomerase SurA
MSPQLLLLLTLLPAERTLVDRVVAVVNEEVITQSELDGATKAFIDPGTSPDRRTQIYRGTLDQLIAEKLIGQQIREAHIEVTEDDIERAIEDITRQNRITRDELKQAIESRGMSMSQYKDDLERQLKRLKLIDLKVRSRVVVPDADVRAEWERQVSLEKRDRMVKLRHLFFNWGESPDKNEKRRVLERAAKGRERIAAGEPFDQVAKEISQGPTAAEGGDLGWLGMQDLLPELARAVSKMKSGELSQPIETENGAHVVLLEDSKLKEPTGFEEAKAPIQQRLYQQEVERQMRLWVDELKAASAVEVRLPELQAPGAGNK